MNDRTLDNQFPANSLSPEQLRQLQNLAALTTGQGMNNNLGLLGSNLNLINPLALQNLLNPLMANSIATAATNSATNTNTQNESGNLDQQTSARFQQANAAAVALTHRQPQQSSSTSSSSTQINSVPTPGQVNLHQVSPQNLSFKRRGRRPKQFTNVAAGNSLIPTASDIPNAALPINNFGIPATNRPNAGSNSTLDNQLSQRLQLQQTIRLIRQQQQRQQAQQQQQQAQQQHQQQFIQQEFTQRLQLQLQQIVQQSQRQQQPHPTHASLAGEPASLSVRQQQLLQNPLQPGLAPGPDQQKRKRGRPPLSTPGTSTGASAVDYNYLNMFAVKSQQDRMQRESKQQQERVRQQQERERLRELKLAQERQREIRLQQEQERQRAEIERQRKLQHRQALQDIDRERRRQHMIMVRNLDAYKRNEEREKTINAMVAEKNKQVERRMYQKRLEVELIKDIRKPIDDMMLKNQKPLATLNRIPGLKLPGKAFADLLMSYEFLHNFGETVGLTYNDTPDINSLQLGLLNLNTWAEDQLISTLHHLCMFAIKDSRFPYTGSTKEIEVLERTNEGLSQALHFYLQVMTLNAKHDIKHEYRLYNLIEQKYFLSLNASQKAEMLAYICNELLCSQTVTKQMEDTIENVAKLRKDKWVLENELRKYRIIKTKRELKEEAGQKAKEATAAAINTNGELDKVGDDDRLDDSKDQIKPLIKREDEDETNRPNLTNGSSIVDNTQNKRENDVDASLQPNNTSDLDDLESGMTNDELNKKIENLTRQYSKTSNKLERAINSMRACPLGQDRFRRRYWVLPQVGGVFVEGMESSEPEELENNKFSEEELVEYEKEQQVLNEIANNTESTEESPEKMDVKEEKDEDEMDIKEDVADVKDEEEAMDIKDDDLLETNELKEETKGEMNDTEEPEVEKSQIDNTCDEANVHQVPTIPWFSILPRASCDFLKRSMDFKEPTDPDDSQKKVREDDMTDGKTELSFEELRAMRHEICPALAKRLEELESDQYESPRKIHPQYQYGWWRITDAQQLKSILSVLHERGSRERVLHKHLTKHFQYACNSCKNTTVDFEITSYDRQLASKNYGAPMPHTDDDSADDLKDGEDEEEDEDEVEELDEEAGDDKAPVQAAIVPSKKSKRKKASRSARSRRLRARAAARKKVENSRNKLAPR